MQKKKEGKPLKETQDMVAWKEEYDALSEEDHKEKLKGLGLDEADVEEAMEVHNQEGEELSDKESSKMEEELTEQDEEEKKKKKK